MRRTGGTRALELSVEKSKDGNKTISTRCMCGGQSNVGPLGIPLLGEVNIGPLQYHCTLDQEKSSPLLSVRRAVLDSGFGITCLSESFIQFKTQFSGDKLAYPFPMAPR